MTEEKFIITKDEIEMFATSMFTDREKCAKALECIRSRSFEEELQKKENISFGMVCAYESGLKDGKKKTIDEILLWRKNNRGKKLGYCTNGMIEDNFLEELLNSDTYSIEEHDDQVRAGERERVINKIFLWIDNADNHVREDNQYYVILPRLVEMMMSMRGDIP